MFELVSRNVLRVVNGKPRIPYLIKNSQLSEYTDISNPLKQSLKKIQIFNYKGLIISKMTSIYLGNDSMSYNFQLTKNQILYFPLSFELSDHFAIKNSTRIHFMSLRCFTEKISSYWISSNLLESF